MRQQYREDESVKEKVVQIRRICKVVKGGKKLSFRSVVVIGDVKGMVGAGVGKASEVSSAIRKAVEDAKKHQIKVPMIGNTIPHDTEGIWGASKVILRPAKPGTGVIAGGAVRTVLELAGIKDVVSKIIGASNPLNTTRATLCALRSLKILDEEQAMRGKSIEVKYVGVEAST